MPSSKNSDHPKGLIIGIVMVLILMAILSGGVYLVEEKGLNAFLVVIALYSVVLGCEYQFGFILHTRFCYKSYTCKKDDPEKYTNHLLLRLIDGVF